MVTQADIDRWNHRFEELQLRDRLPDECGLSHCRACHWAVYQTVEDWNRYSHFEPSCGHTAGCPEC